MNLPTKQELQAKVTELAKCEGFSDPYIAGKIAGYRECYDWIKSLQNDEPAIPVSKIRKRIDEYGESTNPLDAEKIVAFEELLEDSK